MTNQADIERAIINGLQIYLQSKGYECPVILANQTAPIPPYPYISFTITTPVGADMKGYSISNNGTRYKSLTQTWSFTVQSDDDMQALAVAMQAYDWFALTGNTFLSDNDVVVQRVHNINNRDNLLSIEYEYRRGFDVEFLLIHTLEKADCETAGYINTAEIKSKMEV